MDRCARRCGLERRRAAPTAARRSSTTSRLAVRRRPVRGPPPDDRADTYAMQHPARYRVSAIGRWRSHPTGLCIALEHRGREGELNAAIQRWLGRRPRLDTPATRLTRRRHDRRPAGRDGPGRVTWTIGPSAGPARPGTPTARSTSWPRQMGSAPSPRSARVGYTDRRWISTSSGRSPRPAERAAVDAVLGPSEPAKRLARRRPGPAAEGHVARGGHAARSRRDLLIPALHAVQSRVGWISQPALNYVCRRLTVPPAEAYGVATFYALFATTPRPPAVAHVCDDIACRLAGAEDVAADLERALGPAGTPSADGGRTWLRSPVPRAVRARPGGDVHGRRARSRARRRRRRSTPPGSSAG